MSKACAAILALLVPCTLVAGCSSGGNAESGSDAGSAALIDSGSESPGTRTDASAGTNDHDAAVGVGPSDAGGKALPDGGGSKVIDGGAGNEPQDSGVTGSGDSGSVSGPADAAPDVGAISMPTTKVVMYLDNWSGSFASWATKVDFTKMTHLMLAFATVTGTNGWGSTLGDTADVQTIVAAAHKNNVKVLVSIGGGGGDQSVITAYQSASNIAPLVANLDTMVASMNLDGVDVDLESPNDMTSSSNYPAFVKQLISTFHAEGKLVTTAQAEYIVQGQNPDPTIVSTLLSFDFVNDMIYSTNMSDYTSEAAWWTGSTIGLPKENLVWGVCFSQCGGTPSASTVGQFTTGSIAYGGVMGWDYTDAEEATLWPAMQGAL